MIIYSSQFLDIRKWLITIYVSELVSQSSVTLFSFILADILQIYFPSRKYGQNILSIVRNMASEIVTFFFYLSKILLYLSRIYLMKLSTVERSCVKIKTQLDYSYTI